MSNFEYDNSELYSDNLGMNSRNMYINEIHQYPLLSKDDEIKYGYMLLNKENKALLVINEVDGYVKPSLNTNILFYSLIDCSSYKSIISDLIKFYEGLDSNSDKVINMLKKYQNESNKVNRSLNVDEISHIFNVHYSEDNKKLSEKELFREIREFMNYKLAFKKMFDSNLRLVVSIASKYRSNIDTMDLIAEGNLGLMKAIIGYDITLGYRFSTYATACIKQTIRRYIYNHNLVIRLPESVGNDLAVFKRKVEKLEQEEKRVLQIDEISDKLDMPIKQVRNYLMYLTSNVSLDDYISEDESLTIGDTIPSDVSVEEEAFEDFLKTDILAFFEGLSERHQGVIKMRFGLAEYNGKKHTIRAIAEKYSVSQQRVNVMIYQALYSMKRLAWRNAKQKSLRDYYYSR